MASENVLEKVPEKSSDHSSDSRTIFQRRGNHSAWETFLRRTKLSDDIHDHHQSPSVSPAFVSAMIVGIVMLTALIHIGFTKPTSSIFQSLKTTFL